MIMTVKRKITRRDFVKASVVVSGAAVCPLFISSEAFGANDRLRGAVLGVGGRGNHHVQAFSKIDGVDIVGTVDADLNRANSAAKWVKEKIGKDCVAVQDARKIFDDKNIDFVSIATCNHWHSLLGIWAAQAGKHVYVEKPCSQNLFEGCQLAAAMRKYNVCIQHGTQRRCDFGIKKGAVAWAKGMFGKPIAVKAFANRPRNPMPFLPDAPAPQNIDWDLWVGPAAMVPFSERYVPYNWHWYWNFGNGEIGNNGVHYFDVCRIGLTQLFPDLKFPQNVVFFGTRTVIDKEHNYKDAAETPTVMLGICDFNGIPLIFQSCNLRNRNNEKWNPREVGWFVTEDGYIQGSTFHSNSGKTEPVNINIEALNPGDIFQNFINCVRDNTPDKLNAPITEGHFSAGICHLGNVSYRSGSTAALSACRDAVGNNPIMQQTIDETLENVQFCLPELDLNKDVSWTLGKKISINNDTFQIDGMPDVNALLTRPQRAPFIVPKIE